MKFCLDIYTQPFFFFFLVDITNIGLQVGGKTNSETHMLLFDLTVGRAFNPHTLPLHLTFWSNLTLATESTEQQ